MSSRMLIRLGLFGALMTCASAVELRAAAGQKPRLPIGEFYATKMSRPPTIDGKIAPGEWDNALTTSGMITPFEHTLQEAETTVAFGFDQQHFYFLFHCRRGNREWKLTKTARGNDDYSFGDPSVEIWVTPPTRVPETYQNIINTYPCVFDVKMISSRGYNSQGWQGHWTLGVGESDTHYVIEAAVPVKDFGFDAVHDGDVWRFLLCRNSPGTRSRAQASWSVTQAFAEIPQHPKVHLMDDEAVLQLESVLSIFTGKFAFPLAVVAPRGRPAEIEVQLRLQKDVLPAEGDQILKRSFSLRPGERQRFSFSGDVTEMKKGYFTLSAAKKDGTQIFRQSFPFEVNGFVPQKPERPAHLLPPQPLGLRTQYGPETNTLLVRADVIELPNRTEAVTAEVIVRDAQARQVLKQQAVAPFARYYAEAAMSLAGLPIPVEDVEPVNRVRAENAPLIAENAARQKAGRTDLLPLKPLPAVEPLKVLVEVVVRDKQGKQLVSGAQEVALKRYKFPWQNNRVGMNDRVIPPWTPIGYTGGSVGVWNRKMQLDGLGLLRKIDNGGVNQIAAMRLVAVKDGQAMGVEASEPTVVRHGEARLELQGTGRAAGLKLSAQTAVEFDGFVRIDLTISPEAEAAQVDKLYFEVVLPDAEATHFCTTAGGWTAVHDVTPPYWSSQATSSGMLVGDFVPYIWLTNSDRAFLWFADSDRGWITEPEKRLPTQEIVRKDGKVTLRVHFIEVPTELRAATRLSYGYQTFPARPLPPGWRSIVCRNNRQGFPSARNTYFWFDGDWAVLWPYYCSPYPWSMEKSKALFAQRAGDGQHRPCVGSIAHSIGRYRDYEGNLFPEYAVDWGAAPGVIGNADVTNSRGPNDFRLYYYQQWVRQAGFRGLYVDENYLGLEENFLTGNAYFRPDQRLQRAYSYLGLREYFMRIKAMFHENQVPAPNLWLHVSGGAAYHAWPGDIFFEGENVEPTDLEFDYIEVLPAARMRAIGSSLCAGGVMTMMCQSQRHPTIHEPKHTHQLVGWVMAHDILPEQVPLYDVLAQEGRLYESDVQFLPYWKPGPLRTTTPECIVSAHRVGKRALIWVVNTARKDQQVAVDVDFQQLGLSPAHTVALEAEGGKLIPLGDGGFTVPVLQRDFVAVHLIEPKLLRGSESLRASFDNGPEANEAYGCSVLIPGRSPADAQAPALVDGPQGKAIAAVAGLDFWPHLHLTDEQGRITFRAQLLGKLAGPLLTAGPVRVLLQGGKTPQIILQADPPPASDPPSSKPEPQRVTGPHPGEGWHEFDLSWKNGRAVLKIDGRPLESLAVGGFGIGPPTRRGVPRFTLRAEAVDELRCYRTAE